jgi:hypothetical protein
MFIDVIKPEEAVKTSRIRMIVQTLVLIAALAGIAAWYFLQIVPADRAKLSAGKESLLPGISRDNLARVEVSFREILTNSITNHWTTVSEKSDGRWKVVFPIRDEGDPEAFHRIENDIPALKSETNFSGLSRKQIDSYGFGDPSSHIRITLADGKTVDILNGGLAATENYYYTLVNSNTNRIYLVYAYKFSALERNANDIRDKGIFDIPAADVVSLAFDTPSGRFRFECVATNGSQSWKMISPVRASADSIAVRTRIMETIATSASFFADFKRDPAMLARLGLNRPEWSVTLVSADGRTNALFVSAQTLEGYRYAYSPGKPGVLMIPDAALTNRYRLSADEFLPKSAAGQ